MVESESLSALIGLGSKSQEMLARAGATSVARLREVGAVEAYVLAKRANRGASLNLLWALEGPPSGEPRHKVARIHRTSFLLAHEPFCPIRE